MRRTLWIGTLLGAALALAACGSASAGGASSPATQAANANPGGANPGAANPADGNQAAVQPAPAISTEEAQSIQQLSQLTVGILYLQDNQAGSITKDQAAKLLTYYQDIQASLQQAQPDASQGTPQAGGPGGPGNAPGDNGTPQAGGGNGGPGGAPGGNGGPGGGMGGFGMLGPIDTAKLQADLTGIQSTLTADQLSAINALTQDQLSATMQQHNLGMGGKGGGPAQPGAATTPNPDQVSTMRAQGGPGGQRPGNPLIEEVVKVLSAIAAS